MTETGDEITRLGDRYELGGLLGRGGMADVRVGRDLRLGRTVAVKQLRADLSADDTFQARFRREAQSSAALNHPSIVAVYDTGETINPHGTHVPYIVMEYVEGQTLRDILRGAETGRKILPERALSITADVLSALDYSHRSGIVHRDIKPANVMVTPSGQVKVMDFGIARAIADTSSAMTQTAAVIGTAQYLSPEQARGETVDARSDIYSTGCLLYELLTGRPPFVGESPVSVAYQHVREEAMPPSQLNPDVSESIDRIVAKALAKRTDDRYQSAADMRADIERVIAGGSVDAPTQTTSIAGPATAVAPAVAAKPAQPGARRATPDEDEEEQSSRWWIYVLVALLLAAAVGIGIFLLNQGEDPPPTATVPTVVGAEEQVATDALEKAGFKVETTPEASSEIAAGRVISSDPAEGTDAEVGATVTLVVSSGLEQVDIPNLTSYSFEQAKAELEKRNLKAKRSLTDSDEERDRVLNTNPPAGTAVDVGTTVTVIVSRGQATVPDVTGQTLDQATKTMEDAGLKVETNPQPDPTVAEGSVVSQSLTAGQRVARDSVVTLTVSTGPEDPPPGTDADADAGADADADAGLDADALGG